MNQPNTILLVEDNSDDEELTVSSLRDAHVKNPIDVVRDGSEALDYIFRRGKYENYRLPQIVLLDLKLPKVPGLEVLKKLRSDPETKQLPVVVFTSSNEESDLITSYQLGVNSFIQKPVEFDNFFEVVKNMGLYWVAMNKYPREWYIGDRA